METDEVVLVLSRLDILEMEHLQMSVRNEEMA
jgi:hypothetical protein